MMGRRNGRPRKEAIYSITSFHSKGDLQIENIMLDFRSTARRIYLIFPHLDPTRRNS